MIRISLIKQDHITNRIFGACLVFVSIAFSIGTICSAQSGPNRFYGQPSTFAGKILVVPPGTTLEGRIESTIGSSKSHQGERFSMTISSPVLANGTDVIIPVGAEMLGDVVEAIPANKVPHEKGMPKPTGKLRVQISSLKMPDGTTYPLVASIIGEQPSQSSRYGHDQGQDLGGGIAYVGSENNFNAVAPRAQSSRGRPKVLTKDELMRDPIYGKNASDRSGNDHYAIRSLVKKNRNLFIYQGSPISIRLNAPLKIGIGASEGEASVMQSPAKVSGETNIDDSATTPHRFSRPVQPVTPQVSNDTAAPAPPLAVPNVLPGILPDTPSLVLPPPTMQKMPAPPSPQNSSPVSPF